MPLAALKANHKPGELDGFLEGPKTQAMAGHECSVFHGALHVHFPCKRAGPHQRFTDSLHNTIHTYMVVANDGKALKLVNTDPGFVLVLDAEKK